MGDSEVIADAGDDEVDEVTDAGRFLVEAGHGGHHCCSCPADSHHIFQLDHAQRGFSWDEDQWASFFEVNIGSALDEVGRVAGGDGGECAHGAGADDHAIGEAGAAGDGAGVICSAVLNQGTGCRCGCRCGVEWSEVPWGIGRVAGDLLDQFGPCVGGCRDVGQGDVKFLIEHLSSGAADDQVHCGACFQQHLQQWLQQ